MVRGVHEHLLFGAGTIDFPPIFEALREIGYGKGVHVELSRHSHMAVEAVRHAGAFLKPLIEHPGIREASPKKSLRRNGLTLRVHDE
jgi:L-ribulose-5-phosphate 3-epimerase